MNWDKDWAAHAKLLTVMSVKSFIQFYCGNDSFSATQSVDPASGDAYYSFIYFNVYSQSYREVFLSPNADLETKINSVIGVYEQTVETPGRKVGERFFQMLNFTKDVSNVYEEHTFNHAVMNPNCIVDATFYNILTTKVIKYFKLTEFRKNFTSDKVVHQIDIHDPQNPEKLISGFNYVLNGETKEGVVVDHKLGPDYFVQMLQLVATPLHPAGEVYFVAFRDNGKQSTLVEEDDYTYGFSDNNLQIDGFNFIF